MSFKPSLLMLTAGAAALATVANAVAATSPEAADPAQRTRLGTEIQADLDARDASAAKRKRALDLREQAAKAAEARLQASLEAQQRQSTAAGGAGADEPGDQFAELARIYQAMKPAAAAVVFEQLDMEVQMKVAQKMRERSTAMILAKMTPKGAAALSMALARRDAQAGRTVASGAPGARAATKAAARPQAAR